jgi:hypothetical protein
VLTLAPALALVLELVLSVWSCRKCPHNGPCHRAEALSLSVHILFHNVNNNRHRPDHLHPSNGKQHSCRAPRTETRTLLHPSRF